MVAAALSSCKKSSGVDNDNENNGPPVIGVFVGDIAADFSEIDALGNAFTLESFRGNIIVLSFSAMWCGPCRAETPDLAVIYNTYKERGLEIIQCVYQDEDGNPADLNDLARWIAEFTLPFTVFHDPDYSTVDRYKFAAIPFTVVIDRDFIIRNRITGNYPNELRQAIEDLL
jgi:peroxiredoxin